MKNRRDSCVAFALGAWRGRRRAWRRTRSMRWEEAPRLLSAPRVAERLECLEKVSHGTSAPSPPAAGRRASAATRGCAGPPTTGSSARPPRLLTTPPVAVAHRRRPAMGRTAPPCSSRSSAAVGRNRPGDRRVPASRCAPEGLCPSPMPSMTGQAGGRRGRHTGVGERRRPSGAMS